jgi:SAM-dependent methyltransferase
MSQITSGIYSILSKPFLYDLFQELIGAHKYRKNFVSKFIIPYPNERILDIGCGTAKILDYLPDYISYYGFDFDKNYINAAKKYFGNRGSFFCANIAEAKFENLKAFDTVLAIGVLHHLSDKEAKILIKLAFKKLKKGGVLITDDPCLIKKQNRLARFLILNDRGQKVRNLKGYQALTKNIFFNVKGKIFHRKWIPYTHWIMVCKK